MSAGEAQRQLRSALRDLAEQVERAEQQAEANRKTLERIGGLMDVEHEPRRTIWRVVIEQTGGERSAGRVYADEGQARGWYENLKAQVPNPSWRSIRLEHGEATEWALVEEWSG